jgi:hypothetical protein
MVSELVTHEVNVFTTLDGAHVWVEAGHSWLFEVCECEVSVSPIDTIKGHFEVKFRVGVWSSW